MAIWRFSIISLLFTLWGSISVIFFEVHWQSVHLHTSFGYIYFLFYLFSMFVIFSRLALMKSPFYVCASYGFGVFFYLYKLLFCCSSQIALSFLLSARCDVGCSSLIAKFRRPEVDSRCFLWWKKCSKWTCWIKMRKTKRSWEKIGLMVMSGDTLLFVVWFSFLFLLSYMGCLTALSSLLLFWTIGAFILFL